MMCPRCSAESPAGQKFCGECGTALTLACPSCGTASPPGQKFCGECGTPLAMAARPGAVAAAVAGQVAERRVCSVLFCDVVGFTPLSEARDPEAVRELLSEYFDRARTVIGRYGGVVEKFIGDAVMAVWGTPAATEGDAERAVRAALDLVAAVGELGAEAGVPGLAARAGVVTGEVAVNLGAAGEGMVAGDAVNTASRVQAAARAGQVLTDAATQRLAGSAIGVADAGGHALKGKAEPVPLWRATRVRSGVGGSQRVDGLEAPLTGRDAELRTIKDLFHAAADRRGPRVGLGGGPGGGGGWGGTGAGACPTGRGWRAGRWPRSSGSVWASGRRIRPRPRRASSKRGWPGTWPTRVSAGMWRCGWADCSAWPLRGIRGRRCRGRNCSPGGGCSSSGWRPGIRWCCWSRTPTTPTPGWWSSWAT